MKIEATDWVWLPDSDTLLCSPKLLQKLSLDATQTLKLQNLLEILTSSSAKQLEEHLQTLQQSPGEFEFPLNFSSGDSTPWYCKIQTLHSQGQVRAIQGHFRQPELPLESLLSSLDDLVMLLDEQGHFLKAWSRRPEILLQPLEQLPGQHYSKVLPPDLYQRCAQTFAQALQSDQTLRLEYALNQEQEHWYVASFTAFPSASEPSSQHMLITVRQIDRKKGLEFRLEAFQEELQHLNRISFDSELNAEQKIHQALKQTLNYFKLKQAQILLPQQDQMVQALHLWPPGSQQELPQSFLNSLFLQEHKLVHHRLTLPEKWSQDLNLAPQLPPLIAHPLQTGKALQGWLLLTDPQLPQSNLHTYQLQFLRIVSRWIGYMLQQQQNLEQLKDMNRNQDRILSVLSHDLRNSLSSVIGFSQVLRRRDMVLPEGLNLVERIQKAGQNAHQLLQEMLTVQELENSHDAHDFNPTVLNTLLSSILRGFTSLAREKGVQFTYHPLQEKLSVFLHRSWFSRLIENLLSNALKFTPEGGQIELSLSSKGKALRLEVRDTGIGIPTELQPLIFQKFSNARRPGVRGEVSTGLGMYIIEQIVHMHAGKIWFESQENQGCHFFVELPCQPPEKS